MDRPVIAYVLKRYPRYSETFIVNEILAHEAAGFKIRIYSLYPPEDGYFQDSIAKVRAPVTYLHAQHLKASDFWTQINHTSQIIPDLWSKLEFAKGEESREVHQAVLLAQEVRFRQIACIHSHFATAATTVAHLAAHFSDVPYTFTTHAKDIFHQEVQLEDLRKKLGSATQVVTISNYNVAHLRELFGEVACDIQCIYNGLDLNTFPFRSSIRKGNEIVAVGRLIEKKGFEDLIDACAILASRGIDFRCYIIGMGELEAALNLRIQHLALQGSVYLTGPLPQKEVIEYLGRAAVCVVPCVIGSDGNRDGLPTVILESMALGTPCVSTDVTGIPEVIKQKHTGLMVSQHDPVALADSVQELISDRILSERISRNARDLVEKKFDIYRNSEALRAIFLRAIHNRNQISMGVY